MEGFKKQAEHMLTTTEAKLLAEEKEDGNLRGTFGDKWPLPQSSALNGPYKNNINMYRQKLQIAGTQDQNTK